MTLIANALLSVGQTVYIVGGGYYTVASVLPGNQVTLTNLGSIGNKAPGATVTSATPTTTTAANFVQPAVGATTPAFALASNAALVPQETVFIAGGGYYTVASVLAANKVTLTNLVQRARQYGPRS